MDSFRRDQGRRNGGGRMGREGGEGEEGSRRKLLGAWSPSLMPIPFGLRKPWRQQDKIKILS